ncbi:hypothetical protein L218DRAFT_929416 [Marasmius fiardii PR-910]|nr:hypothetical protein L218DRAFT_929416 [Marasmius fiardii PR-910]
MYGNRPAPYARYNNFYSPKQRVLGSTASQVPPAWRTPGQPNIPSGVNNRSHLLGSKILLSQLPTDVGEKEVDELFNKTVGPLKGSFIIYNSAGRSKGMAVVWFQRPGDAAVAQAKYDGKFVDGRRPIRIEIISDSVPIPGTSAGVAPTAPHTLSLLDRIEKKNSAVSTGSTHINGTRANGLNNHNLPRQVEAAAKIVANTPQATSQVNQTPNSLRRRVRKGPRRLKKQIQPKTAEELDREMEDYRAAADTDI